MFEAVDGTQGMGTQEDSYDDDKRKPRLIGERKAAGGVCPMRKTNCSVM